MIAFFNELSFGDDRRFLHEVMEKKPMMQAKWGVSSKEVAKTEVFFKQMRGPCGARIVQRHCRVDCKILKTIYEHIIFFIAGIFFL